MASYNLEDDVDQWVRKVRKAWGMSMSKKVLRKGARIAAKEMKQQIFSAAQYKDIMQDSRNPNKRYRDGKAIASYAIGNLANSVGPFTFKGSPDYFVGPKSDKYKGRKTREVDSLLKVDGYYGNIFNNGGDNSYKGVNFIEKTKIKSEAAVKNKIKEEAMFELGYSKKKNGIA